MKLERVPSTYVFATYWSDFIVRTIIHETTNAIITRTQILRFGFDTCTNASGFWSYCAFTNSDSRSGPVYAGRAYCWKVLVSRERFGIPIHAFESMGTV